MLHIFICLIWHRYMRTEALNHKYVYATPMQAGRIVEDLGDMHQRCTQSYVRRPYGVGLLIAAYDQTGPHLYVTEPSGNYYEYYAMAIGSRSQTSRTYLEKEYESFQDLSVDELVKHALKAIAASLSGDTELDTNSVSVAVVGRDETFKVGGVYLTHSASKCLGAGAKSNPTCASCCMCM